MAEPDSQQGVSSLSLNNLPTTSKSYYCNLCFASFQRREHFERHHRTHSKIKDFQCNICKKFFSRRDTLQRHMAIHGQGSSKVWKASSRASRACTNCTKAKQRCTGPPPCERCSRKSWSCTMPDSPLPALSVGTVEHFQNTTNDNASVLSLLSTVHDDGDVPGPNEISWDSPRSTTHPFEIIASSKADSSQPYTPSVLQDNMQNPIPEPANTSLFNSFFLWPSENDPSMDISSGLDAITGHTTEVGASRRSFEGNEVGGNMSLQHHPIIPESWPSFSTNGHDNRGGAMGEEDYDILISEDYGHFPKPSPLIYKHIYDAIMRMADYAPGSLHTDLPTLEVLHVCVQLYFEHFHKRFPLLHQGTFKIQSETYLLYCVMAAIGSQYSRLANRGTVFVTLLDITRLAISRKLGSPLSLQNDLALAQTLVLLNFALLARGTREGIMHVQYQRNILVTMCRPLLTPGLLFEQNIIPTSANISLADWPRWIMVESWKRVAYFTWLSECLHLVIFDIPPLLAIEDMQLSIPYHDELWRALDFYEWERLTKSGKYQQAIPQLLDLLQTQDIHETHIRPLSDTTLMIATFAVYIGERQALRQWTIHKHYSALARSKVHALAGQEEQHIIEQGRSDIDYILARFQETSLQGQADSPFLCTVHKFATLFRLLRFISYRWMYVASGWMVELEEAQAAAQNIARLLHTEEEQSRQSLLHAARIFRIIRCQPQLDPHDSLLLLLAVLYIWYYDRFVSHDQLRSSDMDSHQILRLDQDSGNDLLKQWIKKGNKIAVNLHISGLGVLNGRDSVPRILREAVRILHKNQNWYQQSNAIKRGLSQMLSGDAPSF